MPFCKCAGGKVWDEAVNKCVEPSECSCVIKTEQQLTALGEVDDEFIFNGAIRSYYNCPGFGSDIACNM